MNHTIKNYKEYGFDSPPFLSDDYQDQYFKLILAQEKAKDKLKDRPNFAGITFSDVSAGGIQIKEVINKFRISLCQRLLSNMIFQTLMKP